MARARWARPPSAAQNIICIPRAGPYHLRPNDAHSVPSFINAFKLFATPNDALAMTCLTALSKPPVLACSCASLRRFVFVTRSLSRGPPSPLSDDGRAFVDTATIEDAMAMTSERCSFRAGVWPPVLMAARRFCIELTRADDWVSRYGYRSSGPVQPLVLTLTSSHSCAEPPISSSCSGGGALLLVDMGESLP